MCPTENIDEKTREICLQDSKLGAINRSYSLYSSNVVRKPGNSLSWFHIHTMSLDGSQLNGDGADQPEALVLQILRLTDELSKFSSFEPNPSLDEVLGSIAKLCHQTDVSSVAEDKVLSRMPVSQTQQVDSIADSQRRPCHLRASTAAGHVGQSSWRA